MLKKRCLALLMAAATLAASAAGEETFDLKYKFTPGETIHWGVEHRFLMDATVSGTKDVSEGLTRSIKQWVVESVDEDGVATLAHSVKHVVLRQQAADRPAVTYDSRKDGAPPPEFIRMEGMIGPVLSRIRVDPTGAVVEREDLIRGAQAASDSDALLIPMPAGPAKVGDDWTLRREIQVTTEAGTTRKVQLQRRYKLIDVSGDRATIRVQTNVLTPINNPTVIAQLVQEQGDGEATFNLRLGKLVHRRLDVDEEVVAFSGASSVMHYEGRFVEKLLEQGPPANALSADGATRR